MRIRNSGEANSASCAVVLFAIAMMVGIAAGVSHAVILWGVQ
jgi:hypothetical protein